jgi:hypothetical protein
MQIELYSAEFLNFVELNLTGDNDNYNRCDGESKYIDSEVFYLFQPCFENANATYDYFSGTKYNARKIIVLRNNLLNNQQQFESLKSAWEFGELISGRFMGREFLASLEKSDPQWKDHWSDYNGQIIGVNRELIELAEKCAYDERVLWVLGY